MSLGIIRRIAPSGQFQGLIPESRMGKKLMTTGGRDPQGVCSESTAEMRECDGVTEVAANKPRGVIRIDDDLWYKGRRVMMSLVPFFPGAIDR